MSAKENGSHPPKRGDSAGPEAKERGASFLKGCGDGGRGDTRPFLVWPKGVPRDRRSDDRTRARSQRARVAPLSSDQRQEGPPRQFGDLRVRGRLADRDARRVAPDRIPVVRRLLTSHQRAERVLGQKEPEGGLLTSLDDDLPPVAKKLRSKNAFLRSVNPHVEDCPPHPGKGSTEMGLSAAKQVLLLETD